jgi:hypothetical protein
MRQLYPSELTPILKELNRQIMTEKYAEQRDKWSFLAAVISNGFAGIGRMFSKKRGKQKAITPDDFISMEFKKLAGPDTKGKRPGQESSYEKNIQDAKNKGLHGPWDKGR